MLTDRLFHSAFHASPIGQYLLAPTDDLEILAVNDAFLRSVARRREDVLGRPLFDVFPNDPDDPRDTGVQDLARSIRRAIDSGTSQTMAAQRYPHRNAQGRTQLVRDMYWSATNTPVYGADGTLLCVSHTTIDITAQVRAEQALKLIQEDAVRSARTAEADRAYLAGVLQAAPVGILVVDRDGDVLQRNPAHAALFGDDLPQQAGHVNLRDWVGWFVDGERAGQALRADDWPLQRALAGDAVDQCLLKVQPFGTGPMRMVLVSSAPIHAPDGGIAGAVAVAWISRNASAPNRPCRKPTGARTNSSPCWRTSCAIRWRRSARRRRS